MCDVLISLLAGLTSTLRTRASLQVEILALRHQLAALQRNKKRQTSLRAWDRILWVALARLWPDWPKTLMPVKPETVISWHRRGFRFYWTWKSRRGWIGRPVLSKEIRDLIRDMSSANVLRGAPRLHYVSYYHDSRCHLALDKDSPETREVQPAAKGIVVEIPRVGGLHHRHERRAA